MQPDVPAPDRRRLISRLAGDYHVNASRRAVQFISRDIVTALTILAIVRANVRDITTSREIIAKPYGGLPGVPTDDRRRPVSVYAVAKDLGLPYETIRRRVKSLLAAGVCVEARGGMIIRAETLTAPENTGIVDETWTATLDFVQEAGRLGVTGGPPGPAGPDVTRQAMRLATAFFLESTCHTAKVMDLDVLGVLTLRTINMANVRHVTHDPKLAVAHAGLAGVVADEERRPISVYALSKFLLIPYETARRTVLRLEERGLVARGPKGLMVSSDVVNRPEVVAGILHLVALTEAYLGDLAAIGVAYQSET